MLFLKSIKWEPEGTPLSGLFPSKEFNFIDLQITFFVKIIRVCHREGFPPPPSLLSILFKLFIGTKL